MEKRNCAKCQEEFLAPEVNRGPYKQIYCSGACRKRAGNLRNYHRRNVTTEQHQKYSLKKHYGMTPEQYEALYEIQKGMCAICGKKSKLFVDHCHKEGNVRGLLCYHCNFGIGHLQEDINIFKKAIEYLLKEPYPFGRKKVKKKPKKNV